MFLPVFLWIIAHQAAASSQGVASKSGFLSFDCGMSSGNYTDAAGIDWTADGEEWPSLVNGGESVAANVMPPVSLNDQRSLYTLRYFPSTSSHGQKTTTASKLCYDLQPPIKSSSFYYLLRASFWMGSQLPDGYPSTRIDGAVSFHVIVDTYSGVSVNITLPQTEVWYEEMYVRALGPTLSFCLSLASDSSDAPFVNAIELRSLPDTLFAINVMNKTGRALRVFDRRDFAAPSSVPPILRYPNDTIDRMWSRTTAPAANTIATSVMLVEDPTNHTPMEVLQTSEVASTLSDDYHYYYENVTTTTGGSRGLTVGGSHSYFVMIWMAEVDPRVNDTDLRVFNLYVNGQLIYPSVDIFYYSNHLYVPVYYSPASTISGLLPVGPFTDFFSISTTSDPFSLYPASIAGFEIMQIFDNPISTLTLPSDVYAVQDLTSGFSNLSTITGDPCLPLDYKYPWLNCTINGDNVPRVTAILLSNCNIAPGKTIPSSINNLDSVTQILLDGNALEGLLPDFSNLRNLQVLNLSNNKLDGSIPESLALLPNLTLIDLRNNNLSGTIPALLVDKEGLTLKYEGNQFLHLCTTNDATCGSAVHARRSSTSLIIGVLVGVGAFFILIFGIILFLCKRKRYQPKSHQQMLPSDSTKTYEVLRHTQMIEATNIARAFPLKEIIDATKNFSTILGKGGFGFVYKGILDNGLNIAVKVLSDASRQGEHEFLNEVSLLSRVHHKNLVGLIGYCIEKKLVLIYEYMSNGSLFDAIFGNTRSVPLNWIQRLRILLDAAQGLAYLHHGCNMLIVHRDVKSSNILLTENLGGKVSDFGISRLKVNDEDALTTKLLGSMGYLDPEFASTLRLSEKVDVYGFGVVLFEILCGQPPLIKDPNTGMGEIHIVDWVTPAYERCAIEEVVDHRLGGYNISSVWKVAEVAKACVQFNGEKRPTMNDVCHELLEALRLESSERISSSNPLECSPSFDVQVHAR